MLDTNPKQLSAGPLTVSSECLRPDIVANKKNPETESPNGTHELGALAHAVASGPTRYSGNIVRNRPTRPQEYRAYIAVRRFTTRHADMSARY